jgi:hypothetical protein
MKKILLAVVVLLLIENISAQQKHIFSFSNNDFLLDGKPLRIISGEMHPQGFPMNIGDNEFKWLKRWVATRLLFIFSGITTKHRRVFLISQQATTT